MEEVAEDARKPVGPGADLRRARERRNLNVTEVAKSLRLSATVVDALEADDYDALPAPIFVKGYLKAYSKLLGVPADEMLAAYERSLGEIKLPPLVLKRGSHAVASGSSRTIAVVAWLLLVAVLVMVALWWLSRPQQEAAPISTTVSVPAPIQEPGLTQPLVGEPVAEPEVNLDIEIERAPVPETVPGNIRLTLTYTGDCWTEVVDRRGERLFFDLAREGRTVEVEGPGPLNVFLGNAPAVAITANGQPFDHSRYNRAGNVARFSIGDGTAGNRP